MKHRDSELEDFSGVREAKFRKAIARMFRSFNRKISDKELAEKANDLSEKLKKVSNDEISPFFEHVMTADSTLPNDPRIKEICFAWKKNSLKTEINPYGYFDINGIWMPDGTCYLITLSNFDSKHNWDCIILELSAGQIDILVKGRLAQLDPDTQEFEEFKMLLNKRFRPRKGKHQIPQLEWGPEQYNDYEVVKKHRLARIEYAHKLVETYTQKEN